MTTVSINIRDILITFQQVAKANSVILTGVTDDNEYVDGKPTKKRLGTKYSCVANLNKYAAFTVKVVDATPVISQENIDSATAPIMISFENFEGKFYKLRNSNDYAFTAKASKANLVK